MDFTIDDIEQGKHTLEKLLPIARKAAPQGVGRLFNGLGEAVAPYLREDNILSVVIHRTSAGGWAVDLLLRCVPIGTPDIIGTDENRPCPTEKDAVASAINLLALILHNKAPKPSDASPLFIFYDVKVHLSIEILERLICNDHITSPEYILCRLRKATTKLFPDGYSRARLVSLTNAEQRELSLILHLAAASGVLQYPVSLPYTLH